MKTTRHARSLDCQPLWAVATILVVLFGVESAVAGRFVNITETAAFPRGEGEVVQAAAFSSQSEGSFRADVLEFQLGVEYGLLNRFQVGFALPNVATVWTRDQKSTEVGGTSLWGLYNLLDPAESSWGLSLAAIYGQGNEYRSGEIAFLAEKPLGDWVVVYNGVAGRSWAQFTELGTIDVLSHNLGASFRATNSLYLGIEGKWCLEKGRDVDWETAGRCVGPNLSVETGPLWITATAHFALGSDNVIPDQIFQAQVGLPF